MSYTLDIKERVKQAKACPYIPSIIISDIEDLLEHVRIFKSAAFSCLSAKFCPCCGAEHKTTCHNLLCELNEALTFTPEREMLADELGMKPRHK